MSSGNVSARQHALHPAPGSSAAKLQPPDSGAVHRRDSGPAECASLAHILETRNHRPMLRLQALQIVEGVCRSLDHTHRNGAIHGDVQPEKIFVTSEGQVRLVGHGNAPTPAYASCEVLEGAPPVAADDLFSAACTGYQLLAGEPAFSAGNALEAERAGQRPARIPHLSPGQWRALDRALAFRRAERQADIESFLDELRSQYPGQPENDATTFRARLPIAATSEAVGMRLPAIAAGVTVIAAFLIALGWWRLRPPEEAASVVPPAVSSVAGGSGTQTRTESGLIVRTEVAPVIDTSTAMPLPIETSRPHTAEPVPADPAPAAAHSAPRPIVTAPETVSSKPDVGTAAESPPAVIGPPRPAIPPVPLLIPRAVVPTPDVQAAPAIVLPATPDADSHIYKVPFSSLKVRRYVDPDYPRNSEGIRMAGWVDVNFGVDERGHTTGLQVTAAEPAGLFEDAALSAVRRWRFVPVEPPAGQGQTVRSEIRVRFTPD